MSSEEEFRSNLVELVKAMGQEMIDRAEDIVGNGDVLHSLTVTIDFPVPTFEEAPTLNVSRDYYSRRCFDLILNDDAILKIPAELVADAE